MVLSDRPKVAIVGGGIVGCATAYYLARHGVRATLLERAAPAAEASGANAGFVGTFGGLLNGTLDFLRPSVELVWQATEELHEPFDGVRRGRLSVALDEAELAAQRALYDRAREAGLDAELLDSLAARACDPALSEQVLGALYLPDDGHVEPTKLTRAYATTARSLGARLEIGTEVRALEALGEGVIGLRTGDGLRQFDHVVLAAGAWSNLLAATVGLKLPLQPGKGQMLATEPLAPCTERVILGSITGLAQRKNGEVVIGSDVEYVGYDKRVDQATIASHFERAMAMIPALREARIGRTWAGLRPMTPDSLPIVGPAPDLPNLWLATGHSRTGMSYGPGTARAIADLIAHGESALPIGRFALERFRLAG